MPYAELPSWLAGWNVALMPFALNDATRYISPTKTPEYLAGGKPVVSTAIVDVERSYGALEAVGIARSPEEFVAECERALALPATGDWRLEADAALKDLSWDATFARMSEEIGKAMARRAGARPPAAAKPALVGLDPVFDYLVVGAGFAGAVLAERLAAGSNKRVLVIDRRNHIGGNAYDYYDKAGVLMHHYGPHIFHTNSDEIFAYLSRFTRWRPYEHRVLAWTGGKTVPMPVNRTTLNSLYGLSLQSAAQAEQFFEERAEHVPEVRTSEDVVVSRVGREIYETFFRGYTRKQWGLDPSELDKSVTSRVPVRTCTDDRYFTDRHQAMPAQGYTAMFQRMLADRRIVVELDASFEDVRRTRLYDHLVYTGPIDEYFGCRFGPLPYRSLEFRHVTLDRPRFQEVGTVNYPAENVPYTRITEYKHLTGQFHPKTTVTYEYPRAEGPPFYPVPRPQNQALYKKYEALAAAEKGVTFAGRLATYRYYNMDQVVGQALSLYRRLARPATAAAEATELRV